SGHAARYRTGHASRRGRRPRRILPGLKGRQMRSNPHPNANRPRMQPTRTTGPTRFVFMVDDRVVGPERFTFGESFRDMAEVADGFRARGGFVSVPARGRVFFENGSVGEVVRIGSTHDFRPSGVTWK